MAGLNPHRRIRWFLSLALALLVAAVMLYCVIWMGDQVHSAMSWDPSYGFASPEHGKLHRHHGILFSYWDSERGRWSFEREGRVCRL